MVCKRCGRNIDPRRRRNDGSLQCPHCLAVYRPRSPQGQSQPNRSQPQPRKAQKENGFVSIFKAIPWKRKIWKFPLWAWTVLALLVLIAGVSPSTYESAPSQENIAAPETEATQQPAEPANNGETWEAKFLATKDEVLAYLDTVFSPYEYFNTPFLDYSLQSPDLYYVTADIIVNGTDAAAVKEALHSIEARMTDCPYAFDFSVGMIAKGGASLCSASFGRETEGYLILAGGKTSTYAAIDEITLEDSAVEAAANDSKYTDATRESFAGDFEKCMAYLGYTAPLSLTNASEVDTGGHVSTYMSGDWYGILLWTDEDSNSSRITEAMAFSSGDGSAESGEKVMAAYASTLYAFDHSVDASKAISTIVDIMDGSTTYETDAVTVSMSHSDATGYSLIIEGKK